ncbi:MAG: NADH-quinone oxidoreductase subunit NuoK [Planctomycetes bacterium]|nr:NADH-quinone oxidoreductase subunit NuoK [Planctomycetota bacterium]
MIAMQVGGLNLEVSTNAFLLLSVLLFSLGVGAIVARRNAVAILMGVELMLNASAINFVSFGARGGSIDGQIFGVFIIILAAAEAAVGLAIVLNLFALFKTIDVDQPNLLKG